MRSTSGFCRLIVISPTVSDWFWTQCQPDGHQISDRVVDEGPAQAVALVKQHAGGQHDSLMQGIAPGQTHEISIAGPSLMNDDVPSRWRGEDHVHRKPGSASRCC